MTELSPLTEYVPEKSRLDKWLMVVGLSLSLFDFLMAVLVLVMWGDLWLDWAYQTTIAVMLILGYLLLLVGLQRLFRNPNRWRGMPLLLFALYPWWLILRELTRL